MLVTVLAELDARGADTPGGLSRTDWLRHLDPTLTAGAARAFVRVGSVLGQPGRARLRMLVASRQVTVAKAAQILEFEQRCAPVADPVELGHAVADVTAQAVTLRGEELAGLIRHHTEQLRPPTDTDGPEAVEAVEEGRRRARGLWLSRPNPTGMVTMRGTLDPEAAAVITSALDPLSAPCATTDRHGHLLERDLRSPARRRADSLVQVVARGVSAPGAVPATDKAKVVVLIDHDTLTGQVRGTGAASRSGRSSTRRRWTTPSTCTCGRCRSSRSPGSTPPGRRSGATWSTCRRAPRCACGSGSPTTAAVPSTTATSSTTRTTA
jgi:hypothetical protein